MTSSPPSWQCVNCGRALGDTDNVCPHCSHDLTQKPLVIELPGPAEEEVPLGPDAAAAFEAAGYTVREDNSRPRGKRRRRQENEDDIPEFLKRAGRSN